MLLTPHYEWAAEKAKKKKIQFNKIIKCNNQKKILHYNNHNCKTIVLLCNLNIHKINKSCPYTNLTKNITNTQNVFFAISTTHTLDHELRIFLNTYVNNANYYNFWYNCFKYYIKLPPALCLFICDLCIKKINSNFIS